MDSFNNFSILAWNIRGASNRVTKRHVRELVKSHQPALFYVCETHVLFTRVERFLLSLGYKPLFIHKARGHSGGLWVLSRSSDSTCTLIESMSQAITFSINRRSDTWYCTFIYASPIFTNRCRFWEYLQLLRSQVHGPWLILGDFNECLFSTEVSGGRFNPARVTLLAQMMHHCSLIDLHTIGGLFTWRKNIQLAGHIRKKLDRVVADVDWQLAFPRVVVEILPQHNSDHNPLLLSCSKYKSRREKMFHFQAACMSHPDYDMLVQNTWSQTSGDVAIKLDSIRKNSLVFNRDIFGNIFKRKRHIEGRIRGVHLQLDRYPTSDLIHLERDLQQQYSSVLEEEEMLWFQKSRENWVKFGNKNTKFYHAQTVIHRRHNKVTSLQINGEWCDVENVLKQEASSFFKSLFRSSDHCDPSSLQLDCIPQICQELKENLLHIVTLR